MGVFEGGRLPVPLVRVRLHLLEHEIRALQKEAKVGG
jgi:hypothetical protein